MEKPKEGQAFVTVDDYEAIKKLYDKAVADGREVFKYKGSDLLVAYAKYLLEYLKSLKGGRHG